MNTPNQFQSLKAIFDVPRSTQPQISDDTQPSAVENNHNIMALVKKAQQALADLENALSAQSVAPAQKITEVTATEGVFDGKDLIAEDGQRHQVPANYASKSRLVEGDLLSVQSGKFKQIHRVKRKQMNATVHSVEMDAGSVTGEDGVVYKVLRAPLSFFKLRRGDKLTIDTPETPGAQWAAVVEPISQASTSSHFAYTP